MKSTIKLITLVLFIFCTIVSMGTDHTGASLVGFNPGLIIDDVVMANKNTESEASIQAFLKSKNSCNDTNLSKLTGYNATTGWLTWTNSSGTHTAYYNLSNGHFVCMADENFSGETAAHIIWQAAQDYSINPQVLIVLLQKEQALVTDTWPNTNYQYAAATGFDCPDSGNGCNSANAGFKTQIRKAAALYREVLNGGWSNYPVGVNYVQYNPNTACGGTNINIQNRATSALYRYTPYQPNAYALAGGTKSTYPECGAFGNRNFYDYFTAWFGSTAYGNLVKTAGGGVYYIDNGFRRPFPSEVVFESYSFKWSNVTTISSSVLALIPPGAPMAYNTHRRDGFLVTSPGGGIYVIENGLRRPFPNEATFFSYGYKWTDALTITSAELALIPDGAPLAYNTHFRDGKLISSPGKGIYLVENGLKRPFPSEAIFFSYSYKWADVIIISQTEAALIPDGIAMVAK